MPFSMAAIAPVSASRSSFCSPLAAANSAFSFSRIDAAVSRSFVAASRSSLCWMSSWSSCAFSALSASNLLLSSVIFCPASSAAFDIPSVFPSQ